MWTLYKIHGPFRKADGYWNCNVMFVGVCQHACKDRRKTVALRQAQKWVAVRATIKGAPRKENK